MLILQDKSRKMYTILGWRAKSLFSECKTGWHPRLDPPLYSIRKQYGACKTRQTWEATRKITSQFGDLDTDRQIDLCETEDFT